MSAKRTVLGLLLLAVFLSSLAPVASPSGRQRAARPKLPDTYKKWLDEEVVYIITPTEREVFQKLQTDRERDLFIEAFWKQRDPTPASAENEFKTEHYRRISYANRYLGRDAPRPGWRTDRGRYYIILGEPRDIQRFEGKSQTYDAEVWFYQGKTDLGLPTAFNLVFFREGGHGEYRLYSPVADGPQALLVNSYAGTDYTAAYEQLREFEPDLAAVSLSLIPGETDTMSGRPSMASDILIQRVATAPARAVESKYAQKFLLYKDLVEVEYTANWLDSDSLVKVFREPSGLYFVHYAIEPSRLSVSEYEGKYYTTLKVNGRVTDPGGRLVHQFDKTVALNLTAEEMRDAGRAPFDFQDLFPLVGGDYSLSVLIKNDASKEFTSVEQTLRIPPSGPGVQMTQPLLGYKAVRLEAGGRRMKAFRVGPYQIYCQPGRTFAQRETLALAFQLNNLPAELAASGEVKIEILKDGQPFRDLRRKPADYPFLPDVIEELPLADFPPAHYAVRASLASGGAEVVAATEEFDVTFAEALPRPWFSSRVLPDPSDPVYDELVGAQLFNLGRYGEAKDFLERASARKPDSEDTAGSLARTYLALADVGAAVKVLDPFAGADRTAKYETFILLAAALKRKGEFGRAVELLDRAVAHYGVNAVLLNAIGECQEGMGKVKEALAAFERSLELSPDQPEIRKRVEELKTKKAG
jgi:GWxTD domain-containing protein